MIDFYTISVAYADYLRQFEPKIPQVSYPTREKLFCGVVLRIGAIDYYAPMSHFNQPQKTNFAIWDKDGEKVLSTVRLCFMFPALSDVVSRVSVKELYQRDPKYAILVDKEYRYCANHEQQLLKRAQAVYKMGCNENHVYHKYCCDFKKLEEVYQGFRMNP